MVFYVPNNYSKYEKMDISIFELFSRFPTNESIRKHLEKQLWGRHPTCPFCRQNKPHRIWKNKKIKGQYLCKDCQIKFTAMSESKFLKNSKVELRKWVCAIYILITTDVTDKGISSHQLAKIIGVTQKTAWNMIFYIKNPDEKKTPNFRGNP